MAAGGILGGGALIGFGAYRLRKNAVEKLPEIETEPKPAEQKTVKEVKVDKPALPTIPPYSPLANEALDFAKGQLERPDLMRINFHAGRLPPDRTHQPNNPNIGIYAWLNECYGKDFVAALKKHPTNTWSKIEVIAAAKAWMRMSFTLLCLTLEDLEPFKKWYEGGGLKRTFAEALTQQDSYQYRTFFLFTQAYYTIRGGAFWGKNQWNLEDLEYPKPIPESHAALFYAEGGELAGLRELYNEGCDRIRCYVNEEELRRADQRHTKWTQKDTEDRKDQFGVDLGPLPT